MFNTGFANNTADLLSKIRTFLTNTLPVAERWTQLRYTTVSGSEELILQSNSTNTIIGFKHFYASGTQNSELVLQHFTGFNSGLPFDEQAGGITQLNNYICFSSLTPAIFTANAIPYWFMGNGRRFMCVAKIASVYSCMYLGFIYPYANPNEWSNPVCIGGSSIADFTGMPLRYFDTGYDGLTNFWNPRNGYYPNKFNNGSSLMIKNPAGSQLRLFNDFENNPYNISSGTFPYVEIGRSYYGQYNTILRNSNNNYHLLPIQIIGSEGIYGEFEGIRYISGNGLNAEDTITIGGETWLCVPNMNLLSPNQWAAFRMS